MSTQNVSLQDVQKFENDLQKKTQQNRKLYSKMIKLSAAIQSIKMLPRVEIVQAAVATIPAVLEVTEKGTGKILTPGKREIPGSPEILKTYFDVLPDDPFLGSGKVTQTRRKQIYDDCIAELVKLP